MPIETHVYEAPKSLLTSKEQGLSRLPGLLLYLLPTFFMSSLVIIIAICNIFSIGKPVAEYKLWLVGLCCILSIPIGLAMNHLSWKTSIWHSKTRFWIVVILGSAGWPLLLSVVIQCVSLAIWRINGFGNGPLPLTKEAVSIAAHQMISTSPGPILLYFPIHFIYSIRRKRVAQRIRSA